MPLADFFHASVPPTIALFLRLDTNRPINMLPVSLATALALALNEAIKLMLEHTAGKRE